MRKLMNVTSKTFFHPAPEASAGEPQEQTGTDEKPDINSLLEALAANKDTGNTAPEEKGTESKSGDETVTMPQAVLSAKMSAEKAQGRNSVLKELGLTSIDEAKEALAKLKEAQNTGSDKPDNTEELKQAIARAHAAEERLELLNYGISPSHIEDAQALIHARMAKDSTLELEEAVKQVKGIHSNLFTDSAPSGTGAPPNSSKPSESMVGLFGKAAAALTHPTVGAAGPDTFFNL